MKADHILVVMNGEIVEEGSHEELIHRKGKYHDLWSKQILVKPVQDRSRSQSPKKRDGHIINDLTPNRQRVELSKALKTTPHDEPSQIDQRKPDDRNQGKKLDQVSKADYSKKPAESPKPGNCHQREVSEEPN
jgi:ABC-type dipeptide/oligopeptide/nickel transport system ATPase component